jgi:chitinase
MKSTHLFLSLSLLMSACGMQPTELPATPEPAPSPTTVSTLTVPPPTATSTAIPTPTNTPAFDEWCSSLGQLSGDFLVIGYLPEYRQLNPAWGNCLTDLIYFSIRPLPDGGLDTSALSAETLQMLREMRTTYGTRIHISVGGWNRSDNFSPMATRSQSRKKFVRNLLSFCLENDLNGVDFDWEFPENEDELQAYADLLTEVKAAFGPRGLMISIALAPVDSIDLKPYAAVDRIHIMSYDRGSKHATLEQAQLDAESFLSAGASQEKLILGMPFYGRAMTPPYKDYTYAEIVEFYHPSATIDEIENVYFNGIGTVQEKTCLAKTMRLGGVMIWELGQDTTDNTSLLRAIYQATTSECEQ